MLRMYRQIGGKLGSALFSLGSQSEKNEIYKKLIIPSLVMPKLNVVERVVGTTTKSINLGIPNINSNSVSVLETHSEPIYININRNISMPIIREVHI